MPQKTASSSARKAAPSAHALHTSAADAALNAGHDAGQRAKDGGRAPEIFVDPMLGGPLPMFVERDVDNASKLIDLIMKYGGQVSSGYSNVNYIIVNPTSDSGRNLARQYAGKKGKVVLSSNWVHECIKKGELQTFKTDWAGCRLDGYDPPQTAANILSGAVSATARAAESPSEPMSAAPPRGKKRPRPSDMDLQSISAPLAAPHASPGGLHGHPHAGGYPMTSVSTLAHSQHLANWNIASAQQAAMASPHHAHPHAHHMVPSPMQRIPSYPPGPGMGPQGPQMPPPTLRPWEPFGPAPPSYAFHYPPPDHWDENAYYQHPFQPPPPSAYPPEEPYVGQGTFATPPSDGEPELPEPTPSAEPERGRHTHRASRSSTSRQSIAQAGAPRGYRKPLVRSPTPPTRIMKSTFGGNLFTSEDILYLKKYIDYCQQQGLILSLREICERLAIRAPHHTFYSWRRFCNKHQIKLGAYDMSVFKANVEPDEAADDGPEEEDGDEDDRGDLGVGLGPGVDEEDEDEEVRNAILGGPARLQLSAPPRGRTVQAPAAAGYVTQNRDRSPTPPKTLYRSTTGKGVAFTEEDVRYLLRYLQYAQGQDMVQVWRDIAQKAPHHSRASWMKYWRRHKHEFDTDRPPTLPQAGPDEPAMKRRRYDRADDVKLARLMLAKPQGTSDQIFQSFALLPENAHHPWKGWQEHHRIHKAKIDHVIAEIEAGSFKD